MKHFDFKALISKNGKEYMAIDDLIAYLKATIASLPPSERRDTIHDLLKCFIRNKNNNKEK